MGNQHSTVEANEAFPPPKAPFPSSLTWPLTLLGVGLLAGVIFVAYEPAIHGKFIWDDQLLIVKNKLVNAPDGLFRMWFTNEPIDYWPLTNTAFWIEWRLWGTNPIGYHVTNLLLHLSAVLLIWAILRQLMIPGAFLAALLFAVHPVNVESVAWIAQRKNTLAMVFFLVSIFCFLKTSRGRSWYWLSLSAFVLAMLSKGSVAVLPLMLLLIAWWQQRTLTKHDWVRTAPFFVVAIVLTLVNIWFQTHGAEIVIREVSLLQRLVGAGGVVWFYLSKALLPIELIFVYPQWQVQPSDALWLLPLAAAITATAVLGWNCIRKKINHWPRSLFIAWAFFCVALLPVLGFVDVYFMKFSLVADHYQHLALVSVMALVAAGWSVWRQHSQGAFRSVAFIAAIGAVGCLTLASWQQCGLYRDAATLFQATLDKNPDCWLAYNNLGLELLDAGRPQDAIKQYERALRLKPDLVEAQNNMGTSLLDVGRIQEAVPHLLEALRLQPDYADAHNNLANALAQSGRLSEAIDQVQVALQLKPDSPEYYNNLAIDLAMTGRHDEAVESFNHALQLRPNYPEAHNNLAVELVRANRLDEAIDHYRQALQLKSDYADAHKNLANALLHAGRSDEAIEQFLATMKLRPDDPTNYVRLIKTYEALDRPAEAIAMAQKALDLAHAHNDAEFESQIQMWLAGYRLRKSAEGGEASPENQSTPTK